MSKYGIGTKWKKYLIDLGKKVRPFYIYFPPYSTPSTTQYN